MTDLDAQASLLALFGTSGNGTLATLKADGRPQLSVVTYAYDPAARTVRISTTDDRAKARNLRRDPRVSLEVVRPDGWAYAVVEGTARLTDVATAVDDPAVDELVDLFRAVNGEHPDWTEYRQAMVDDLRVVVAFDVERVYGWAGPQ